MTKEIEARGLTSFNLIHLLGCIPKGLGFKPTLIYRTREQIYSTVGEVIAGGLGLAFGGPMAGLAASFVGKGLGSRVASWQNIPEQAETEEKLKYLNESINSASNLVASARNYVVSELQSSTRFGTKMGSIGGFLGYTPDRTMMIRTLIGEALGRDDVDLSKEQMRISRIPRNIP